MVQPRCILILFASLGLSACALAPQDVAWAPIATIQGQVALPPATGERVALSWILNIPGIVDGAVIDLPFAGRRELVTVVQPKRSMGGQFELTLVEAPPGEAFLPVEPGGVLAFGEIDGEIAFGSLAVVALDDASEAFTWHQVDEGEAAVVLEKRDLLVMWWDGPAIDAPDVWYSALRRGPNLVRVTQMDLDADDGYGVTFEVVPMTTAVTIADAEETLGYDACGNTSVDQIVINAAMSEYTYPEGESVAWCSLYGTTLTHLVCEEILGALCSFCRVEVTTLAYGDEPATDMGWYCDESLADRVGTECTSEDFVNDDFPDTPFRCVRGELYGCEAGTVEYLGDTGCPDCSDECD